MPNGVSWICSTSTADKYSAALSPVRPLSKILGTNMSPKWGTLLAKCRPGSNVEQLALHPQCSLDRPLQGLCRADAPSFPSAVVDQR